MTGPPAEILRRSFGHDNFRPGQREVIDILLAGRPALAVFPTGGGKSLCYQLPALLLQGLTVVVSPLIALMKDQVDVLVARGIAAARLDSTLDLAQVREIYERMRSDQLALLYVAPERLGNEGFLRRLRDCRVALLAVDEAHCISEWGHNFRPDYLKLARLAREISAERVLALTATATPEVAADIRDRFDIRAEDHVQTSFYRPNLHFEVEPCPGPEKAERLLRAIRSRPPGSTVVYVTLQRTAEEFAGFLKGHAVEARAYHAGMRDDHRAEVQDAFMSGGIPVVVATIAFGMGIDKADIRYVYHYNLPKSLENYVQESGRAGRDGAPATCGIFASREDLVVLENFVFGDTPSRRALRSLVEHLLLQGEEFSISQYDLSGSKDIRPLVISTALTYLELDGVIRARGPFYAGYRVQLLRPLHRILDGHTPERKRFLERLFQAAKKGRVWYQVPVDEIAAGIGEPPSRIRRALDYLADLGDIVIQPSGLRHAFTLGAESKRDIDAITERLHGLFQARETGETRRIAGVVEFCESGDCLAGRILEYFGEDPIRCGHCSACSGANPGRPLPAPPAREITSAQAGIIAALHREAHPALRQPRQLARFLCGLSSPATTRAKLSRHERFGMLESVPFLDVLAHVESLGG